MFLASDGRLFRKDVYIANPTYCKNRWTNEIVDNSLCSFDRGCEVTIGCAADQGEMMFDKYQPGNRMTREFRKNTPGCTVQKYDPSLPTSKSGVAISPPPTPPPLNQGWYGTLNIR